LPKKDDRYDSTWTRTPYRPQNRPYPWDCLALISELDKGTCPSQPDATATADEEEDHDPALSRHITITIIQTPCTPPYQ